MLTSAQYDRLPSMARAIVDADRSIQTMVRRPVITIADAKVIRDEMRARDRLVANADATWGHQIRGDGTAKR